MTAAQPSARERGQHTKPLPQFRSNGPPSLSTAETSPTACSIQQDKLPYVNSFGRSYVPAKGREGLFRRSVTKKISEIVDPRSPCGKVRSQAGRGQRHHCCRTSERARERARERRGGMVNTPTNTTDGERRQVREGVMLVRRVDCFVRGPRVLVFFHHVGVSFFCPRIGRLFST